MIKTAAGDIFSPKTISEDLKSIYSMGYFDERDPAVKRIIAHLIKIAHTQNCRVSICGEGPSNLPDFTEFLVSCGIDSISVNADSVVATRQLVKSVEQKIILKRLAELSERYEGRFPQKRESTLTWTPE